MTFLIYVLTVCSNFLFSTDIVLYNQWKSEPVTFKAWSDKAIKEERLEYEENIILNKCGRKVKKTTIVNKKGFTQVVWKLVN